MNNYKRLSLVFHGSSIEKSCEVIATLKNDKNQDLATVQGSLPANPELSEYYRRWRRIYRALTTGRLETLPDEVTNVSVAECEAAATLVAESLNRWLEAPQFKSVRQVLVDEINRNDPLQFIIQSNSAELQSLPWQLCQMMEGYPNSEVCFSLPEFKQPPKTEHLSQIKVLAVFGGDEDIDLNRDRKYLYDLKHTETEVLNKPTRQEFSDALKRKQWDVLFFAGHSFSSNDSDDGYIKLNDSEWLALTELPKTLKVAIENGLKLAIFNSCDGIGLARNLLKLNLPRVIVMREPVPDKVAWAFLKEFLTQFSQGKPLFLAVRIARDLIKEDKEIQEHYPWASWLPAIFQHPATPALQWKPASLIGKFLIGSLVASVPIIVFFLANSQTCWVESLCPPIPQKNPIVIGALTEPQVYEKLTAYLKKRWRNRIQIIVDGNGNRPYAEGQKEIASRRWDVAFTLSPWLSVVAENNRYTQIARMFPENPAFYKSSIFVRSDSPIKSLADIGPQHKIALGDFNSISSFYAPIYMLYGKTLRVDMKHRGREIFALVRTGKVDMGAAAIGDTIQLNDPSIRIIAESVNLPGSGVYTSPSLTKQDRAIIQQALLEAPSDIRDGKHANYGPADDIDYTELKVLIRKAEAIVACNDFDTGVVRFACIQDPPIQAQVVDFENITDGTYEFTLVGEGNTKYLMLVTAKTLNQIPQVGTPFALKGQRVAIRNATPKSLPDGSLEIRLDSPEQITLLGR